MKKSILSFSCLATILVVLFIPVNRSVATQEGIETQIPETITVDNNVNTKMPALVDTMVKLPQPTKKPAPVVNPAVNNTNYWLAPVSKNYTLPSNYSPAVVGTGLRGSGLVTLETKKNLVNLFNDAQAQGIEISIFSSFRSYQNQAGTFNYWVNHEMQYGFTKEEAIIEANKYSAKPGQSEHQLGTVVDLKCNGCGEYDITAPGNVAVYNFLKENAHKYGFVISYPDGKQALTGYKAEPWHIRYIGVEYATELYNMDYLGDNDMYLTSFLIQIGG